MASSARPAKLEVLKTPFCDALRSKKYYLRDEIITEAEDYHDGSGHTFCYHTQLPIGVDGSRAAPEYCTPDRACYRSAFEAPVVYEAPKPKEPEDDCNLEV